MSVLISLKLDGLPPTVNHMYRTSGRYRYKTAETRMYQEHVSARLRELWNSQQQYTKPVELFIKFFTNNKKRWDIDNRVKALQDCLSIAGVIRDDTQIDELHVKREYSSEMGTEIILSEIPTKMSLEECG